MHHRGLAYQAGWRLIRDVVGPVYGVVMAWEWHYGLDGDGYHVSLGKEIDWPEADVILTVIRPRHPSEDDHDKFVVLGLTSEQAVALGEELIAASKNADDDD